ncbi:MAG: hypothetical protein HKN31_09970 [Pricia sp.]|nr:hypothetical protein [Pricia sp.]
MPQNRQLSAIMFTDIEAYTSFVHDDEFHTIVLRKHPDIFDTSTEFNGTIVPYFGEGASSFYTSSVDAIHCSIELQLACLNDQRISLNLWKRL